MNTKLKPLAMSETDIENNDTVLYFSPGYTGAVHLILGSFVLETTSTVDEALELAKRYQPAARRCDKPVELVPTDINDHTAAQSLAEWWS